MGLFTPLPLPCNTPRQQGRVEKLHCVPHRLGAAEVGVTHHHREGRVPHQFLGDLEGSPLHGPVAAVSVPQVMPADATRLSERRWDFVVPEDEGGLTPPATDATRADESSTATAPPRGRSRRAAAPRSPDEVPTEPGVGPRRRTLKRQPTA